MEICSKTSCTGCGACAYVCVKNCIEMKENHIGIIYPFIDESKCINCCRCKSICPQNNSAKFRNPIKAYAAWSSDEEERRTSASGGIAAELYKLAINQKLFVVGAISNSDFSVSQVIGKSESDIIKMKNSKYVFSTAYNLYGTLAAELQKNHDIIVIGLPCQVAAIENLFPKYRNQLTLVDVVCHGTTPFSYLQQHIKMLEKQYEKRACKMFFRDPETYTYTFTFTLYDQEGNRFYSQRTKDGDTYQFGYHRTISYRENCYQCKYACEKRISDITLSDYKGLGRLAPCDFTNEKVSSILVNTSKGEAWIEELIRKNCIVAHERPVQEPVLGDAQLQHPSVKGKARYDFEKYIRRYDGDFEKSMKSVIRNERIRNLPRRLKSYVKRLIR